MFILHPSSFILRETATIPEALALAVQHHQKGHLQQAEAIYRQVLQVDPNHPDALHLLGVIAARMGRHDLAIRYIKQAIRIRPTELLSTATWPLPSRLGAS